MTDDTSNLQINDAVHVERGDSQQLEGVVAYLGSVQFSQGDDWVGVRLTGTSVGLGKNDGSVQGVSYFQSGHNGGVFVRRAHVSKRDLTKLEALRLKRELAKKSAGITSPRPTSAAAATTSSKTATTKTPTQTPSGTRPTVSKAVTESSEAPSSPSKLAAKTRLDEIKARRAALTEKKATTSTSVSPTPSTRSKSPIPVDQEKLGALQKQVEELSAILKSTQEENTSLQQSLSKAQQDMLEAKKARDEAQEQAKQREQQQVQDPATRDIVDDNAQDWESELFKAQHTISDLKERLQEALSTVETTKRDLQREQKDRQSDIEKLTQARSQLSALEHEFQAMQDQSTNRSASDAEHYKERAKLQAELSAVKRQVQDLEKEKVETESILEELTLDKEQLQEEKEAMLDKLEEYKVDAETAQMEVEELKMEVEIAKEAAEGRSVADSGEASGDAEDIARGLSVQNARLREALIRLREQSSFEKIELSRQLRDTEKDVATIEDLTKEVESLREAKEKLDEEVLDLKLMVDQGSAFESMVESLSDRVLLLEDDNTALQSTIRELEEAADITAEMEEVQAEENKALMRDLEARDAVVLNLEEAIKMQRRREEDFQRTVANYRKAVETLKQEKKALLAFQEGDEGKRGDLLAASQKALARAAQLVADASNARKREAEAVFDRIEADVQRHLSKRLEMLLPENVASSEIAAVKGELLLSRVVGKASKALDGMSLVFSESIRLGTSKVSSSEIDEEEKVEEAQENDEDATFRLTDESMQCIANMLHQAEVAVATINVSSDLLKLLSAGQWPDLLTPENSSYLGAAVGNAIADLDFAIGDQLRILKEEGVLTPHTSNIGAFEQTVQATMQSLKTTLQVDGSPLVSQDWSPPGLVMLRDVSISKFCSISIGAVVASIVSPDDGTHTATTVSVDRQVVAAVRPLMAKLDQICSEATKSCHRLVRLELQNDDAVVDLSALAESWKGASVELVKIAQETFSAKAEFTKEDLVKCEAVTDAAMRELAKFSSALRAANLTVESGEAYHPFSPEAKDAWEGISSLARTMRSIDGDADDVNYLIRAAVLENQLTEGVESGPKLSLANTKIGSLEKSLSSRSKEIAMQNARISELEKVLAKSSLSPSPKSIKSSDLSSSEEWNTLKEENRVLTEAMDVLHRQVDEYENEIRALKDFKSPKSTRRTSMSSRASPFMSPSFSAKGTPSGGGGGEPLTEAAIGALEAALVRPALEAARQDASRYKAQTMAAALSSLPPLNVTIPTSMNREESKECDSMNELESLVHALSEARSQVRMQKASVSVVDLSKTDISPRQALLDSMSKTYSAEMKLADIVSATERWLGNQR